MATKIERGEMPPRSASSGRRQANRKPSIYALMRLQQLGDAATFDDVHRLTFSYEDSERMDFFYSLPESVQSAVRRNLHLKLRKERGL